MLTSTPCNCSAVRMSPGLWRSDLQILLLLPSWQRPPRKSCVLPRLLPKDLSIANTHDRYKPHARAAESSAAGTFGERSPQVGVWEVQEETSVIQCRDVLGAHPAALTLSQGKKETCSRFIQQEALKLRI